MTNKDFTVTTSMTVTEQFLTDLIITGVEGGIGYWATVLKYDPDNIFETVIADDEDSDSPIKLTRERCQKALQTMANNQPFHFKSITEDDMDSETGDVFIQIALLGEIVYG